MKHFILNYPVLNRVVILFILLISSFKGFSQQSNLVNNAGFELYTTCPSSSSSPPPPYWYAACRASGTYCNACCTDLDASVPYNAYGGPSYQPAHNGNGYVLCDYTNIIGSNLRYYIQTKLKDSLRKGKLYYCEYYVNSPNSQTLACNNIGMLFTDTPRYSDPNRLGNAVINANPQILNYGNPIMGDTLNWLKVSGILKAKGGEFYLTLGNFKNDANTLTKQIVATGYPAAGYYIDDVSVLPLDSFCLKADAGKDTTIKQGDSVFIGSYTNGIDTIRWLNQTTNTIIDSLRPGFWVKPTATTSYILCQQVNGCATCDTVTVNVTIVPLKFLSFSISPSFGGSAPSPLERVGVRSLWQTANEVNVSHFNLQRSTNGKDFITIGKVKANNKTYNEYSFTDDLLTNDLLTLYYRIAAVDFDGKMTYSEVKKLTTNHSPLTINIFPNPAKDVVHIIGVGLKQISVVNSLGQIVIQQFVNNNNFTLDVSLLPKGIYMLQMINKQNNVYNEKLIVE